MQPSRTVVVPTLLAIALTAWVATGCVAPQRPYSFQLEGARPEPVAEVVRALAASGEEAEIVDTRSSVVHTTWHDTGFGFGYIQGAPATIVRRYTAIVQVSGNATVVTLRMDAKRCVQGAPQRCESLSELPGEMQDALDRLGADVQTMLQTGTVVTRGPYAGARK